MRIALDTNVLVYFDDEADVVRRAAVRQVVARLPADSVVIPAQVMAEFARVLLHKQGYSPSEVQSLLTRWSKAYEVVETSLGIIASAVDLNSEYPISFWDAVVLSSATSANCQILLTEDMDHGWMWSGVTIVNPFEEPMHPLLEQALAQ